MFEKPLVVVNLAIQRRGETFHLLNNWIHSENKWIRRLAVATIPPYIRARKTDSEFCLRLLEKAMLEIDRDVQKAVGWALREVSKKDPDSVFHFLMKWTGVEKKEVKWIIREGMKKLPLRYQEKLRVALGGGR